MYLGYMPTSCYCKVWCVLQYRNKKFGIGFRQKYLFIFVFVKLASECAKKGHMPPGRDLADGVSPERRETLRFPEMLGF